MHFLNVPISPNIDLSVFWIENKWLNTFWDIIQKIIEKRIKDKQIIHEKIKESNEKKPLKPSDTICFSVAMALRIVIAQQVMLTTEDHKKAQKDAMKWWKNVKIAKIHRATTKSVKKSLNKPITPEELKSWMEYELWKIQKQKTRELTEKILMGQNISLAWFAEEDRLKKHLEELLSINASSTTLPDSSL